MELPTGQQMPQPSDSLVESTGQQYNTLKTLQRMKSIMAEPDMPDKFGILQGYATKGRAAVQGAEYDPRVVEFGNLQKQLRLSAQSIIKGIPSNFDVQQVVATMPDFNMPHSTAQNKADIAENLTKELYRNSIAFWKTKSKVLPPDIVRQAEDVGINVDNITPWDGKGDPINRGRVKQMTQPETQKEVKEGTQKTIGGITYEWDGKLWQPR
jgi:hypothetical protein